MSTSYWNKILSDNTIESGSDDLIKKGLASWSQGRQDIKAVSMYYANTLLLVSYNKEEVYENSFRQTDLCISDLVTGQSKRYGRCVSAKVEGCNSYTIENSGLRSYVIKLGNGYPDKIPSEASVLRTIIDRNSRVTVEFK